MKRPRTRAEALALRPSVDVEAIRARLVAGQEQYAAGYLQTTQDMDDVEALLAEVDRRGDMILSWMRLYELARWPPTPTQPGAPSDAPG